MANKPNHDLALARITLLTAVVELLDKLITLFGAVINYSSNEKQVVF